MQYDIVVLLILILFLTLVIRLYPIVTKNLVGDQPTLRPMQVIIVEIATRALGNRIWKFGSCNSKAATSAHGRP